MNALDRYLRKTGPYPETDKVTEWLTKSVNRIITEATYRLAFEPVTAQNSSLSESVKESITRRLESLYEGVEVDFADGPESRMTTVRVRFPNNLEVIAHYIM